MGGLVANEPDWQLWGQNAGLGFVLGLAVGYSVKKALRVALLVAGVLLTVLVAMGRAGFITVHWELVEQAYTRAMSQAGGPAGLVQRLLSWFSGGLAAAGGFSVGFWVGFRMG